MNPLNSSERELLGYLEVCGLSKIEVGNVQKMLTRLITKHTQEARQDAWISLHQGASCCKDKHQTFYGAIVTSPQWGLWQEQQRKKPTRDMAEVEELGCMSSEHFQEFLGFCLATLKSKTGGK